MTVTALWHTSHGHTVEELWDTHRTNPSPDSVNMLVVQYSPLVKYVAGRVQNRLPAHVDNDEITQAGLIGLAKAIAAYDPTKNVQFETYATHRIEGNILDELRAQDTVSRKDRHDIRNVQEATEHLEEHLGRAPTVAEIATHLGITPKNVHTITATHQRTKHAPIDDLLTHHAFTDRTHANPGDTIDDQGMYDTLWHAVHALPRRDKQIIALYYQEKMTFTHIAAIYNITESRVSQLHKRIVRDLARLLTEAAKNTN